MSAKKHLFDKYQIHPDKRVSGPGGKPVALSEILESYARSILPDYKWMDSYLIEPSPMAWEDRYANNACKEGMKRYYQQALKNITD